MPTVLGIDWAADMAEAFAEDLYDCTFVKSTGVSVNPADPTGPPVSSSATYTCKAIAFAYDIEQIDGESITQADYAVMILLGTIEAVADDAEQAELDLADETAHVDTVLRAVAAGATGNLITVELVDDALVDSGTIQEIGTNVRIGFLAGATTVARLEALLAQSSLLEIKTAGTPGAVLDASDAFGAVALAGGVDASSAASGVVPGPADLITVPPPNQTVAKTARVVGPSSMTQAAVTVQVRGEHL